MNVSSYYIVATDVVANYIFFKCHKKSINIYVVITFIYIFDLGIF